MNANRLRRRNLTAIWENWEYRAISTARRLSWRPEYDPFFYEQLAKRARRLYLFREEYIFDAGGVVVETPQLGHATYLFAKPASMESFLALYIRTNKEDIRANRNNVAERLGFLGRLVHGGSARGWLQELRRKLGEPMDCAGRGLKGKIWGSD